MNGQMRRMTQQRAKASWNGWRIFLHIVMSAVLFSMLAPSLEQRTTEMSSGFVGEDEAGKKGEAGNPVGLSMEPDATSRRRSQKTGDRSSVNCSRGQAGGGEMTETRRRPCIVERLMHGVPAWP